MLVAKVAAIVVLTGIGIGFLVAAANSGGGQDGAEVTVPAVPSVADPGEEQWGDPVPTTTTPTPTTTIAAPPVGAQTTVIAPKPTPTSRPAPPRPADEGPIAQLNRPCAPEGTYAVAGNGFEPLVCRNGRWARLL